MIMEKLKNPVSHISVLFRLRVKEKNMNRIFNGEEGGESPEEGEEFILL